MANSQRLTASLLLARCFLLGDGRTARAFACARIGVRALSAYGQTTTMAQAAITADVHQTFDVHLHAFAQVALNVSLPLADRTNAPKLILIQIAHARVRADARFFEDRVRARTPDAVNVCQSDLDAFIDRKIDPNHTSHS